MSYTAKRYSQAVCPSGVSEKPEVFVRRFFEEETGHPLVAWTQFFDKNHDRKVTLDEFVQAMAEMGYKGNSERLFQELDEDGSGFLTISEICPQSSDLWASFQHWAAKTFFSEEDMIEKLSGRKFIEKKKQQKITEDKGMTKKQFYNFASSTGWYGGYEQIIFMAMDVEKTGVVYTKDISWFEGERARHIKKAKYKKHGKEGGLSLMRKRLHALRSLTAFTHWLKYHYGPRLFHPWRRSVDKDGSMEVSRQELSSFCKVAGWRGDTNALWHALDSDESGVTSLDEFAGSEARALALFQEWAMETFGSLRKTYKALVNKVHLKKTHLAQQHLDKLDFCFAVTGLGYLHDPEEVYDILDWEVDVDGECGITYKELRCLENWTPVEWLSAEANPAEAAVFKEMLFDRYRHPLKAWQALDETSAGKVSYKEFSICAARIGFRADTGHDVPGAWMALDGDASGYIALTEIAPQCADALCEFRRWANLFFGSIMNAFMVLDSDGGGSLSKGEFKKSVTKYHFRGDREELFDLLDIGGDGDITVEEMSFLDEWEYTEVCDIPVPTFLQVEESLKHARKETFESSESSDDIHEDVDDEDMVINPYAFHRKRDGQFIKEHHLPIDQHRPMPGPALVELLGGILPKSAFNQERTQLSCLSTSDVLPSMNSIASPRLGSTNSIASPRLGSTMCSSGRQSPRKLRSLRHVPYVGGAPLQHAISSALMKKAATRRRPAPSKVSLPFFH